MRFSVINLGCKVNRVESDAFERKLLQYKGSYSVENNADIVVINTCTVTSIAEKKTRKCVRRALRDHPSARVIVTGCAASQSKDLYEKMSERVIVSDKFDVESCIDALCTELQQQAAISENSKPKTLWHVWA